MKNVFKLFGLIALVAVIGFSFAAGGNGDPSNQPGGNGDPSNQPGGNGDGDGDGNHNLPGIDITVRNTAEWNNALNTIKNGGNGANASSPKTYTITVNGNVMVTGSNDRSFGAVSNAAITIKGNGKLYLIGQGSLLTIYNNQTVYIDSADLTLQGLKTGQNDSTQDNNTAVVFISGGTLELRNGTIRDNIGGSGVTSSGGGSFTMTGGTIANNTNNTGGGVSSGGSFTMSGGTISGNTGIDSSGSGFGGGVYIGGGSFTMSGGTISGNSCAAAPIELGNPTGYGGGVCVYGGSFTMTGGTISGNLCGTIPTEIGIGKGCGGGVCVYGGSFTMSGGTISGNSARGGMNDDVIWTGIISTHNYFVGGGGVYVYGNASPGGSFTKSGGGSISGNDVTSGYNNFVDSDNLITIPNGTEVFWQNSPARYRNAALGTADNISTNTLTGWEQF